MANPLKMSSHRKQESAKLTIHLDRHFLEGDNVWRHVWLAQLGVRVLLASRGWLPGNPTGHRMPQYKELPTQCRPGAPSCATVTTPSVSRHPRNTRPCLGTIALNSEALKPLSAWLLEFSDVKGPL